jgi:hypothetical protein
MTEDVRTTCPRCAGPLTGRPAISRVTPNESDQRHICGDCARDEAMRDYWGAEPVMPDAWPLPAEVVAAAAAAVTEAERASGSETP